MMNIIDERSVHLKSNRYYLNNTKDILFTLFSRREHLLILFLFSLFLSDLSAQRLVNPNRPGDMSYSSNRLMVTGEFQTGFGKGEESLAYSKSFTGFNAIFGYQASRNFIFGLGTGVSFYNGGKLFPLFLDIKYIFKSRFIEPYLFADGGMLLDFSYLDESKIFMNPGFGARYYIKPKFDVFAGAGLFFQSGNSNQDLFINLKAGVTYKF
jgi:hypothetical protein